MLSDKFKDENKRLKKELSELKKQCQKLNQKLEKSKNNVADLKKELKKKRRSDNRVDQRTRTITFEPIKRHRYSEFIVRLSTTLYTQVDCGFRQVVKILEIINQTFKGLFGKVSNHNTIENWVKKCGLKVYEDAGQSFKNVDYAQIVDDSMMIGSEKLLLTIGIPAKHQKRPLNYSDVSILDIAIAKSWNGEKIGEQLVKAGEKVGYNPLYVISDNASIMKKGIECAKMYSYRDISHSLGMYLERTYKNESDFNYYVKRMSKTKTKYNMTAVAYLLPPTQRTIARFINLSNWVKWSLKMLDTYHTLNTYEREVFSYIPSHTFLIKELSDVIKCIADIEYICKHNGLSEKTVGECQNMIEKYLLNGNSRMINLGNSIIDFLKKELEQIELQTAAYNNSSDIIESLFGKYKSRKSPNKLYGITSHILFLPIYTELSNPERAKKFDFKTTLEEKNMNQIHAWSMQNLSPNLVQLRIKRLQKAG